MDKITTDQIMALQDSGTRNIFVRWSRGPKFDTNPSRDYVSGRQHAGLSAVWIDYWDRPTMVRRLREYEFLRIKDAEIAPYIYQADEIGKDSDGYSSITNTRCLGVWDQI